MIVIDASALTALILRESCWREILDFSDIFISVDFSILETANAIRSAYISKRIDKEQSLKALEMLVEFSNSNMILKPSKELVEESLRIALDENIAVYDAAYIVLAKREKCPLLTLDRKQLEVAVKYDIRVKRI